MHIVLGENVEVDDGDEEEGCDAQVDALMTGTHDDRGSAADFGGGNDNHHHNNDGCRL